MVTNAALRRYVQDRLAVPLRKPAGRRTGPHGSWTGRRLGFESLRYAADRLNRLQSFDGCHLELASELPSRLGHKSDSPIGIFLSLVSCLSFRHNFRQRSTSLSSALGLCL